MKIIKLKKQVPEVSPESVTRKEETKKGETNSDLQHGNIISESESNILEPPCYVIACGAFSIKENAETMKDDLKRKGFESGVYFIPDIEPEGKSLYIPYVGAFKSQESAAAKLSSVKKIVKSAFVKFLPDINLERKNRNTNELDASFGVNGKLTTEFGGNYDEAFSVVIQPDGKIIAAGGSSGDFALARYNANGTLDNSFGTSGKLKTNISSGTVDKAASVVLQADGKILAAGTSSDDFALVRYNKNGTLDNRFGEKGKLYTDIGDRTVDGVTSIVLQANGQIVVAGHSYNGINTDFALVRYDNNGTLDYSFGTNGKVITDFGSDELIYSIAIQADGKIIAAGGKTVGFGFYLARYNPNGTLDNNFGINGKVTGEFYKIRSVVIQSSGKIVLVGGFDVFALTRYNSNGTIDNSFGYAGRTTTDFGSNTEAYSATVQTDGKILVAGWTYYGAKTSSDFALARYNSDGTLDSGFGLSGKITTDFGADEVAYTVALQPDGKIVAAGFNETTGRIFALARYNSEF